MGHPVVPPFESGDGVLGIVGLEKVLKGGEMAMGFGGLKLTLREFLSFLRHLLGEVFFVFQP